MSNATPVPRTFPSDLLVNSTTSQDQITPSIAGSLAGSVLYTWTDTSVSGSDTSGLAVRGQFYKANGQRLGVEFVVNGETQGNQSQPSAASLSDGGFIVAYVGSTGILAQRFSFKGSKLGAEIQVDDPSVTGSKSTPAVSELAGGGFVVTWYHGGGNGADRSGAIHARIYDADGVPLAPEFTANSTTTEIQFAPAVAALSNGGFVVAWADGSGAFGDTSSTAIVAQRFDATGNAVGADFLVNSFPNGAQVQPTVTGLEGGGFVISWKDSSNALGDDNSSGINMRVFDSAGAPTGAEVLVNSIVRGSQTSPKVDALQDGGFVVTWADPSQGELDTTSWAIRAQVYNADGTARDQNFLVNTITEGAQQYPSVTGLADGRFAVGWQDNSRDGADVSKNAIRGNFFDPRESGLNYSGSDLKEHLIGTRFTDRISGGEGRDVIEGGAGPDKLNGNEGADRLLGGKGNDVLDGGDGSDVLIGGAGGDILKGGEGRDRLLGGDGNDVLRGGSGRDTLNGGKDNDVLLGGKGKDTLIGGGGRDYFEFRSEKDSRSNAAKRDVIDDFSASQGDKIDLSKINIGSSGTLQTFTFIGDADFKGAKGELRYELIRGGTLIEADIDGDGAAEFAVTLTARFALTEDVFIL